MDAQACPQCARALTDPWWPRYNAKCYGCAARELAQSPGFFYSEQAHHYRDDYTANLRAVWGRNKADILAGHRAVQEAARRLQQPRLMP